MSVVLPLGMKAHLCEESASCCHPGNYCKGQTMHSSENTEETEPAALTVVQTVKKKHSLILMQ